MWREAFGATNFDVFSDIIMCLCECSLRRRMHPGALFLCAQAGCGKRFKTRNAVELHRSTVGHGETPFRIVGSSPPPDKGWMILKLRPQWEGVGVGVKNWSHLRVMNISERLREKWGLE